MIKVVNKPRGTGKTRYVVDCLRRDPDAVCISDRTLYARGFIYPEDVQDRIFASDDIKWRRHDFSRVFVDDVVYLDRILVLAYKLGQVGIDLEILYTEHSDN